MGDAAVRRTGSFARLLVSKRVRVKAGFERLLDGAQDIEAAGVFLLNPLEFYDSLLFLLNLERGTRGINARRLICQAVNTAAITTHSAISRDRSEEPGKWI